MANGPRSRRGAGFPLWLLATALLGVLGLWAIVADADYARIFVALSGGVATTLWVTLVAFALACLLALVVALLRTCGIYLLRQLATFYVEIVRGIPLLVFLFYVAFVGAPALVDAVNALLAPLIAQGWVEPMRIRDFDFTWRAIVALTVCYAAFIAEIFRAGIEAVDRGQIEAAQALGLRRRHVFRFIVAPQALRTILPPLGNDFVSMIKDSALVSALGVQDITQIGKVYSSGTFRFFETYNVVAFLYLTMTISLSLLVRLLEQRLKRGR
ncbi:MAG TPA: amino acid ABC transporter permease [Alphaproteobacteria bacterium]|nr:amino acid ABC transporter permease [Alphaproteobacteria bacterium]